MHYLTIGICSESSSPPTLTPSNSSPTLSQPGPGPSSSGQASPAAATSGRTPPPCQPSAAPQFNSLLVDEMCSVDQVGNILLQFSGMFFNQTSSLDLYLAMCLLLSFWIPQEL